MMIETKKAENAGVKIMTVNELIAILQECVEDDAQHGEMEVKLAHQQNYPLRSNLSKVIVTPQMLHDTKVDLARSRAENDGKDFDEVLEAGDDVEIAAEDHDVVWLVESSQDHQHPYAPNNLWNVRYKHWRI